MICNVKPNCEQYPSLFENNISLCSNMRNASDSIFPFQFVYGMLLEKINYPRELHHDHCHLVVECSGNIKTDTARYPLKSGDLFFSQPDSRTNNCVVRRLSQRDGFFKGVPEKCGQTPSVYRKQKGNPESQQTARHPLR